MLLLQRGSDGGNCLAVDLNHFLTNSYVGMSKKGGFSQSCVRAAGTMLEKGVLYKRIIADQSPHAPTSEKNISGFQSMVP